MIKCNRKKIFVNLRRISGIVLTIMLLAGSLEVGSSDVTFMPLKAYAGTTIRQGNKIVNTTTSETLEFDGYSHKSTVYAGEIKRDGETVLNYLFSEDITRSSVVFDNLRKALPNPYSDMVPAVVSEQTQKGLKEMSADTVNDVNLSTLSGDWKDAGNIASQIYKGKSTSGSKNELMYDVSEECRAVIDEEAREREEGLDNPVATNKRVISHLGTKTIDDVHFQVIDGDTVEVHDVKLIYLSEATTLIYTTVNVVDHTHTIKLVEVKEPTYTEDGYKEHYECTECGAWFQDVTGVSEIKDKSRYRIPKLERDIERDYNDDSSDDSDDDSSDGGSSFGSLKNSASQALADKVNNAASGNIPASDVGGKWNNDPNADTWTYTKSDGTLARAEWMCLDYNGLRYWYYFNDDGNMQTNWFDYNNERFYLMPEKDGWRGRMATGWKNIENKWYYFETVPGSSQGRLYRSTVTPDGHTVGADGAWNGVGETPVGQK